MQRCNFLSALHGNKSSHIRLIFAHASAINIVHTVPYSTVVVYIRSYGGLGLSAQKLTKNLLHNTILVPWQYWLGITKPKSAFSMNLNASNRLLQI